MGLVKPYVALIGTRTTKINSKCWHKTKHQQQWKNITDWKVIIQDQQTMIDFSTCHIFVSQIIGVIHHILDINAMTVMK